MAPPRPRQPPELMAEIVEEILLRLPPDAPACLARTALVCKIWRRLLSDPAFRRRYRAFHRAPPMLGFLHNEYAIGVGVVSRFVPTVTPSPLPQRALDDDDCRSWCALDCRHGRALFDTASCPGTKLVVWDPITGRRRRLPEAPAQLGAYNAAVLCAVHDCDHLDCRGGPFLVVLVGYNGGLELHLYSSEAGAWSASADLGPDRHYLAYRRNSVLIGDNLYFVLVPNDTILKYNLDKNCLSITRSPEENDSHAHGGIALMPMEDGSLGLARVLRSTLCLWSRNNADPDEAVAGWVRFRVIHLQTLIPFRSWIRVVGSAEGFGIVFMDTDAGVFTIELKSGQVRKVGERTLRCFNIFPFMSFYAPDCASSLLPSPAEAH